MLICLNDLFACSGLTQTCKLLTNFSKNSFYLLPEPLRRGEFLTNYFIWNRIFRKKISVVGDGRSSIMEDDVSFMQKNMPQFALFVNKSLLCTNFKETMQSQEMRSKYNLRSNEFHSGAVSFSFFEKDIFSSLVMR